MKLAKATLVSLATLLPPLVLTGCEDGFSFDEFESETEPDTSYQPGSCTYTNEPQFDIYYHWQAVVAAWENYERSQVTGTQSEQRGAYNNYVFYYNNYSDLLEQYKSIGDLPTSWICSPKKLSSV